MLRLERSFGGGQGGKVGVDVERLVVLFLVPELLQVLQHGRQLSSGSLLLRLVAGFLLLASVLAGGVGGGEEVEELRGVHVLEACVVLVHHAVGDAQLEALQPHDLLLQRPLGDQPVDVDDVLLADTVRAVHGLEVAHRIPIMLDEDHSVSAGEVQPEPPDVRGEEQDVDGGVGVELLLHLEAPCVGRASVHAQESDRRHARA
mmetsp:Transcript_13234/g.26463  ORF Transcript_13234/g.26463 Transcript_13234/m.26463 type:complete len:203 (+) Transcript_13234:97-705(+)